MRADYGSFTSTLKGATTCGATGTSTDGLSLSGPLALIVLSIAERGLAVAVLHILLPLPVV